MIGKRLTMLAGLLSLFILSLRRQCPAIALRFANVARGHFGLNGQGAGRQPEGS